MGKWMGKLWRKRKKLHDINNGFGGNYGNYGFDGDGVPGRLGNNSPKFSEF